MPGIRSIVPILPWAVIVVQWAIFTVILFHFHHRGDEKYSVTRIPNTHMLSQQQQQQHLTDDSRKPDPHASSFSTAWTGVSVTLALRAPKWFHRRYTAMLHNVLANTPDTWAVQVVVHPDWWRKEILYHHRGMQQLVETNPRVIITPAPEKFYKSKPKHILMSEWFWSSIIADRVLLFSGNGVLCANSGAQWDAFDKTDYVGAPWSRYKGIGGDGSTHSLRNRTMMLEAVQEYSTSDLNMAEPQLVVKTVMKLNEERGRNFRLALPNETMLFGGARTILMDNNTIDEHVGPPRVVSGTQPSLPWDARDVLLQLCPEWKLIFPSLHEPSCFGASPKAEACAASVCALQPNRPKRGC